MAVPLTPPIAALGDDPAAISLVAALIVALLLADLLVFAPGREPTLRESITWSAAWLVIGLAAAIPVAVASGSAAALDYTTVYLIERTLSLDNLVVFLLIFASFAVPHELRGRLLFWGIALALVVRGLAIVVGVELIDRFHFVTYVLGVLLLVLAWRMWQGSVQHADPAANPLVRLVGRVWPVGWYAGNRFSVRRNGRRELTPLAMAVVAVVAADIAFAIDSVPAAFAITDDPLVIWAANGFALLGLRALFALVEALVERFRYLNQTVAVVLGVVAVKLLIQDVWKVPAAVGLVVVIGLFAGGIWLSVRADRREALNPAR